jgi:hypothetical protein
MQDLREQQTADPKTAAKRLRTALKEKNIDLSHGECLDLVARQQGLKNWNVLAARLGQGSASMDSIDVPAGWLLDGANTESFVGGLAKHETYRGQPVFWLRNANGEQGHAVLLQCVSGEPYRGKRVRFSGHLRAASVAGSATIWLRADDDKGRFIAFSNLEKQHPQGALKGTSDWVLREIVLDFPADTQTLNFGFYLYGMGEARFSGFDLQIVGHDVPVTRPQDADAPVNLDFNA